MTRFVDQVGPRWFDQDVNPLGRAGTALRVADYPAHRVAGGYRARAHELLALLQGDVGDLACGRVSLIERAR